MYYKHLKKEDKEFVDECVDRHSIKQAVLTIQVNDKVSPYRIFSEREVPIPYHADPEADDFEYKTTDKLIYLSVGDITVDLSVKEAIALIHMLQFEIENVYA